jgi:hypothetical protein
MRKLLVTLDDDLANLLAKYPNQNEVIRESLRLYIGNITTDTREGLRASFLVIAKGLKEIDGKLDYIASKVQ